MHKKNRKTSKLLDKSLGWTEIPFLKSEWDFSPVPREEIEACLLWEYGRECEAFVIGDMYFDLQQQAAPSRYDKTTQTKIINPPRIRRWAKKELEALIEAGFDYYGMMGRYFDLDRSSNEWYDIVHRQARPYSPPWQELSGESKRMALEKQRQWGMYSAVQPAAVVDLELLWNKFSSPVLKIRNNPDFDPKDDSDGYELHQPTHGIKAWDEETEYRIVAAFVIDFKRHSNKDIVKKFDEWVTNMRPSQWPQPIKRGKKKNDALAALEALGIMRSFHRFKWRDQRFPAVLKKRGAIACYKARKRALRRFHSLFPFLPASEVPISWPTAARFLSEQLP